MGKSVNDFISIVLKKLGLSSKGYIHISKHRMVLSIALHGDIKNYMCSVFNKSNMVDTISCA